ncbi:MAG TPA: hypothetical protein VMW37_01575 [Dehalococcoidales bacterium]|nr:hypothetical protein [Dehalococcoidales bacterium]
MPQPGEVLLYTNYIFEDGTEKDKLFVVLNIADIDVPCFILQTTSQSKHYKDVVQGCNPKKKVFFIPKDWEECFKLSTYIQLPRIIEIPTKELLEGTLSKNIRVIDSLSIDCYRKLKNCLKQFKEDISPYHWKLIFKS